MSPFSRRLLQGAQHSSDQGCVALTLWAGVPGQAGSVPSLRAPSLAWDRCPVVGLSSGRGGCKSLSSWELLFVVKKIFFFLRGVLSKISVWGSVLAALTWRPSPGSLVVEGLWCSARIIEHSCRFAQVNPILGMGVGLAVVMEGGV